ncbi:MAG TPA: hypothetical protein GX513_07540 [Firmicutes bacterium]|nr:hypothetical protein [Bacillota bacterium]
MNIMCVLWKQVPACPVNDIADFMESFSPAVEVEDPQARGQLEVFLDVTGCHLPRDLGALIERRTGTPPCLGLGKNKFVAHTAALLARPRLLAEVPAGREKDFLSPLSVDLLPLASETCSRLRHLGLTTMGQLASLPRSALAMQFGPEGARAWDLANGIDVRSLIPRRPLPQLSRQITFDTPVVHREELTAALEATVEEMVTTLIQQQLVCGALSIDFHLYSNDLHPSDRHSRDHGSDLHLQDLSSRPQDPRYRVCTRPPHPTSSLSELVGLLRRQLPTTISSPVTSATLTLLELKPGGEQMSLFTGPLQDTRPPKRDEAVAAIQRRWGKSAILRVISREPRSLLPEKRLALIPWPVNLHRGMKPA